MAIGRCTYCVIAGLSLIHIGYASAQIPQIERSALIALYDSTDGNNWNEKANWLGPAGAECTWFGVVCSGGSVHILSLYSNNLNGSIPPELGNLTSLRTLSLGDNQLSGSIPSELGYLTNLEFLRMQSNQLSGAIPVEIANLAGLCDGSSDSPCWCVCANTEGCIACSRL